MKKAYTRIELIYAILGLVLGTGWITNVIWLFGNCTMEAQPIMALVGVFVAPIGALHGIYLWF